MEGTVIVLMRHNKDLRKKKIGMQGALESFIHPLGIRHVAVRGWKGLMGAEVMEVVSKRG